MALPGLVLQASACATAVCTRRQSLGGAAVVATAAGAQYAHVPVGKRRSTAMVFSCPRFAHWIAPGTAVHRIHVFLCCLRWSLVLADAVCWWLVGEVRSSPHARAGLLGSFYVVFLFAQNLVGPWADAAIVISVFHPAAFPRSPDGQVSGATSITRATELFAGWQVSLGRQAGPDAKALTIYCAATSSPARADAPMATEEAPEATRDRRAPTVASPLGGPPPTKTLDGVARLPAHDAAGPAC